MRLNRYERDDKIASLQQTLGKRRVAQYGLLNGTKYRYTRLDFNKNHGILRRRYAETQTNRLEI